MMAATGQSSMPNAFATPLRICDSLVRFCGVPVPCACTKLRRRIDASPTSRVALATALAKVM